MRPLKTSELLKKLSAYDFYDWENEFEFNSTNYYVFKMPDRMVMVPNFYNSWGFEAVNNVDAIPVITSHEWLTLENRFLNWISSFYNILFPDDSPIVTPRLTNWWYPFDVVPPEWNDENRWQQKDFTKYLNSLKKSNVIFEGPTFKENCRGIIIESINEFEVIAKMAIRNFTPLFFSNGDRVIKLTNYLTVEIEFKDSVTKDNFIRTLISNNLIDTDGKSH